MLYGPNTNQGSILTMIEYQVEYVLKLLRHMTRERLAWIDVRPDAESDYNEWLQEAITGVEVWHAGCNGYYRAPNGRVVTQWPRPMGEYGEQLARLDPAAYEVRERSEG